MKKKNYQTSEVATGHGAYEDVAAPLRESGPGVEDHVAGGNAGGPDPDWLFHFLFGGDAFAG